MTDNTITKHKLKAIQNYCCWSRDFVQKLSLCMNCAIIQTQRELELLIQNAIAIAALAIWFAGQVMRNIHVKSLWSGTHISSSVLGLYQSMFILYCAWNWQYLKSESGYMYPDISIKCDIIKEALPKSLHLLLNCRIYKGTRTHTNTHTHTSLHKCAWKRRNVLSERLSINLIYETNQHQQGTLPFYCFLTGP